VQEALAAAARRFVEDQQARTGYQRPGQRQLVLIVGAQGNPFTLAQSVQLGEQIVNLSGDR